MTRRGFYSVALACLAMAYLTPSSFAVEGKFSDEERGQFERWEANTRAAVAAEGSGCQWQYVGVAYDPATPGARVADAQDPITNRMTRVYVDCNGMLRTILEPTPGQAAQYLFDRVVAQIPLPDPGLMPRFENPTAAVVKVDIWTWLANPNPITATGTLLGVTTTITARPSTLATNWGDGTTTTCDAPGLDFNTVDHPVHSPTPTLSQADAATATS
jgi:hypothetical protein